MDSLNLFFLWEVITMTSKTKTELNEICRIIVDTIQTNRIYLFGSYAYGSPDEESDYDICVIIPDSDVRIIDEMKSSDMRLLLYNHVLWTC